MDWIRKLNELRHKNPDRKIIFCVDSEVVQDDCHSYWYAEDGSVFLDEVLSGFARHDYEIALEEERMYTKSEDKEEIIDLFHDEYGHHYENEIPKMFENLPWKEVIVVRISV